MAVISGLQWPWAPAVVAGVVLVLLAWWGRRTLRRPPTSLPLAHVATLRSLPRYQRLARHQRRTGALLTVGALVVLAGAAVVVARPQTLETGTRESRARDLMLCLDASASMDDDNATVVRELRSIIDRLEGDRVGLMIWSSAAVLVFPLTDDYDYVRAELDRAQRAFEGSPEGFYAGVDLSGAGASLIGDGIVSCARRFDRSTAARTRVLLVTSDNDPRGRPAYSLAQATAFAARRDVLVYGIGAPSLQEPGHEAARAEFASVSARTGGVFTLTGQEDGPALISSRIQDLARARSRELPRPTSYDAPYPGVLVAGAGLMLLALGWWTARRRPR